VIGVCVYVRLEIEAQEQALEQLEKSTQEATRRAHDAEQKAKSALDALKVCLSHKLDLPLLTVLTTSTCFNQIVAVWQCMTMCYGVMQSVHSTCVLSGYSSVTELT